jgi:hypothetical protein
VILVAACTTEPAPTTTTSPPATSPTTSTTADTTSTTADDTTTTTFSPEAAEILAALGAYQTALVARDGVGAADLVDEATIRLYAELVAAAAAQEPVETLPFIDALVIVRLRHRYSAAELSAFGGRDVFIAAVEEGMVSSTVGTDSVALDSVNISGDSATGVAQGTPVLWFVREEGTWRVALAEVLEQYGDVLGLQFEQAAIQTLGPDTTRRDALLWLGGLLEGGDLDPALLDGPRS